MDTANVSTHSAHRAVSRARSADAADLSTVRVRFDAYELDGPNATLLRDGKAITLAPKPFEVLCALARQPGLLLTKNALLDAVWGHRFVTASSLKTAIAQLRIALKDDARNPRFIETVSRRGYRFIAAGIGEVRDSAGRLTIEHAVGINAERVLHEIREMLLLLVEQSHGRQGAADQLMKYVELLNGDQMPTLS